MVDMGFLDVVQLYVMYISSYRLLDVGWDDWDTEALYVKELLHDWQSGVLRYLRVHDGGVKDEHLPNYNHVLLNMRNYECNTKVGGDT